LAIILAEFSNDKRNLLGNWEELTFPAVRGAAFVKVIEMS
jgi:hypothetical protein